MVCSFLGGEVGESFGAKQFGEFGFGEESAFEDEFGNAASGVEGFHGDHGGLGVAQDWVEGGDESD